MAPHPKNQLTAISVARKGPGRHLDGDGLYLVVDPSGARRWVLRIVVRGKRTDIGLGGFKNVSLATARTKSRELREIVGAGGDPRAERAAERARRTTFRDFATQYIDDHRSEWKNAKHAAQWNSTLEQHAYPVFGDRIVADVDSMAIVAALKPIWTKTPETASRLRARIETILDAAKAKRLRSGDNPAAWAGGLQASLPRDRRRARIVHHAALPYAAVSAFLVDVKAQTGIAARALEFAILTAARTGEVIGAQWNEIDLDERVWNVPKERMKAGKPHRVPLSPRAVELLEQLPRAGEFLFGTIRGEESKPLSNMAMLALLKRMKRTDVTVHGMRSTFRDWAAEQTAYPREVIEHALAHQLADESEAALPARGLAAQAPGAHGRLGDVLLDGAAREGRCHADSKSERGVTRRTTRTSAAMRTKRKRIDEYAVLDKHNRRRTIIVTQEFKIVEFLDPDTPDQEVAGAQEHRTTNGDLVNVREDGSVEDVRTGEIWRRA